MASLRELQQDFMRSVLEVAPDAALPVLPNGIAIARRLAIYVENARANFSSALVSSYPITQRLVGARYFEQCAQGYQREHPSRRGDLQPAGAQFADYLTALHSDGDYRYLGDIARFEWLLQETLLAADHAALDLKRLSVVPIADYERLTFRLHPSVRLFESRYPCSAIWRSHGTEVEPPLIDLHAAPHERLALMNFGQELRFHALTAGEHAFLRALQAAVPFAAAVEAGVDASAGFDAGAALRRFVPAAVIVDFQLR